MGGFEGLSKKGKLMDTKSNMVVAGEVMGEVEEGMGIINQGEQRLDLGTQTHNSGRMMHYTTVYLKPV